MPDMTITALFDAREEAEAAIDRLIALGLPVQNIHMTGEGIGEEEVDPRPLFDRMRDYLLPDEDRDVLERAVEEGAVMVTALSVPLEMEAVAVAALDDAGAVEIDEEESALHESGLPDMDGSSAPMEFGPEGDDARTGDAGDVLAGISESLEGGTEGMRGMGAAHAGAVAGRARLVRRYPRKGADGVAPERDNLPS